MELSEAIEYALDSSGYQLMRAFEGLNGDEWNVRITDGAKSPQETVVHLTECCIAAMAALDSQPYEWGSYRAESELPESLLDTFYTERRRTARALADQRADKLHVTTAMQYIALHEAYHVGQICLLRMTLHPDWDPYSILEH